MLTCLTQHYKSRFQSLLINLNVKTDKEAHGLWELLKQAQLDNVQPIYQQSNLVFTTKEVRQVLKSLKPKNSSAFDNISNKRFKKWSNDYGILPWQQSGSYPNQCTATRVNHLLEQTYTSLLSNTFTPIVFVDFLQAFDLLWQEGLLLKLHRLNCPFSHLIWIKDYFTDRSMIIDFNGQLSNEITLRRGAPQASVFGAITYIVAHHDLHMIFQAPENNHLYADDLERIFIASLYDKYKDQLTETELRINNDLVKLQNYATERHQPVNSNLDSRDKNRSSSRKLVIETT